MTNLKNDLINMINQHDHFKNLFGLDLLRNYVDFRLKHMEQFEDQEISIPSITNDIIDYLKDFYFDK